MIFQLYIIFLCIFIDLIIFPPEGVNEGLIELKSCESRKLLLFFFLKILKILSAPKTRLFFSSLPHKGVAEKTQLLKLNVPATFMLVALDEGPGPPIKYQYAELGKLYTVVSQLIRCCNVSSRMQSSINGTVAFNFALDPLTKSVNVFLCMFSCYL